MIYKKISRMAKKVFSSKTYVLAFMNSFIPENFGKIINLNIDREEKNIFIELEKEKKSATVELSNYSMLFRNSKSFLVYETLAATGFIKPMLKSLSKQREIEIEPRYVTLVNRFVRR